MRIYVEHWQPATINKLLSVHWSTASKIKKEDYAIIALHGRHIPKATGKRRVTMTIQLGKGQRSCDVDAYFKSALDGLVKCGLLVDDNRQGVELMPVQFTRAGNKATEILLEDM